MNQNRKKLYKASVVERRQQHPILTNALIYQDFLFQCYNMHDMSLQLSLWLEEI